MIDSYRYTRECIDEFNMIQNKMRTGSDETTDEEDEKMINHSLYLAHALIKDAGYGRIAREELCKMADIINDICR